MKEENKKLKNDLECAENYIHKIDKENFRLYEEKAKLHDEVVELHSELRVLKRYVKHIQEYLCNDIFELMKKEEEDYED